MADIRSFFGGKPKEKTASTPVASDKAAADKDKSTTKAKTEKKEEKKEKGKAKEKAAGKETDKSKPKASPKDKVESTSDSKKKSAAESKSPHFPASSTATPSPPPTSSSSKPTDSTATAAAAAAVNKKKKRTIVEVDDLSDDDGIPYDAPAQRPGMTTGTANNTATTSPAKPVVVRQASEENLKQRKDMSASDFFGAAKPVVAKAAPTTASTTADTAAKLAARIAAVKEKKEQEEKVMKEREEKLKLEQQAQAEADAAIAAAMDMDEEENGDGSKSSKKQKSTPASSPSRSPSKRSASTRQQAIDIDAEEDETATSAAAQKAELERQSEALARKLQQEEEEEEEESAKAAESKSKVKVDQDAMEEVEEVEEEPKPQPSNTKSPAKSPAITKQSPTPKAKSPAKRKRDEAEKEEVQEVSKPSPTRPSVKTSPTTAAASTPTAASTSTAMEDVVAAPSIPHTLARAIPISATPPPTSTTPVRPAFKSEFGGGDEGFDNASDFGAETPQRKKMKVEDGSPVPAPSSAASTAAASAASSAALRKPWGGPPATGALNPGSKEIPIGKPNCLTGLTFVITGQMEALSREDVGDLIKKYGGRVTSAVSSKTDYLLAGLEPGDSKMSKAKSLKTKIISEDDLLQIIRDKSKGWTPPAPSASSLSGAGPTSAALAPPIVAPGIPLPKPTAAVARALKGSAQELAILHSGQQAATDIADMLWVDAYRPLTPEFIIGNPGLVKEVGDWLANWHKQRKLREAGISKAAQNAARALLISGPPGIGKSTAATVIARSKGYEVVEFNASDTRSKKSLQEVLGDMTGNRGMSEFFSVNQVNRAGATASSAASASSTTASKGSKPTVIIMDEVDGMGGNEDRGGMAELVQIIKHTRTPIICIANDASSPKMRTLKNYCLSLTWRRVAAATLAPRLCEIARKEGLQIDQPSMEKIAESTQGDIRQMLNMLQMLRKASTHVTFDQVKARLDSGQKDLTLGAFDVVPMLFRPVQVTLPGHRPSEWIDDRINYYFVDSDIVPLFIFENYLHYKPTSTVMSVRDLPSNKSLQRVDQQRQNDVLAMEAASQAADSISCGDVISDAMFSEQDYSLQPIHAMLSTVTPSYIMRGVYEAGGRMGFPALLGKQSTRNKFLRIAREFKTELQADVRADADDITMWILPLMREEMIQALENNSAETDDGIAYVVSQLNHYGLDKDEFDLIMQWGESFIPESRTFKNRVPSNIKTKLTNAWKNSPHLRKVSRGGKDAGDVTRGRSSKAVFKETTDEGDEDGDGEDEEEDEEEDGQSGEEEEGEGEGDVKKPISKDINIVPAKAKAGGKGGAKKAGAAASGAAKKPRAPRKPKAAGGAAASAKGKKKAAADSDDDDEW